MSGGYPAMLVPFSNRGALKNPLSATRASR
jgi:hypothetical protein